MKKPKLPEYASDALEAALRTKPVMTRDIVYETMRTYRRSIKYLFGARALKVVRPIFASLDKADTLLRDRKADPAFLAFELMSLDRDALVILVNIACEVLRIPEKRRGELVSVRLYAPS